MVRVFVNSTNRSQLGWFIDPLVDAPVNERSMLWRITANCRWYSTRLDTTFTIPTNLLVDYYSVPRPFWNIFPPREGREDPAAGLHDYLVRYRKRLGLGLRACHREFRNAMRVLGASRSEARIKWLMVWSFNWMAAGPGDGTPYRKIADLQAKYPVTFIPPTKGMPT